MMQYTDIEKAILLGLKERHRSWLDSGGRKEVREIEEFWKVIDKAYGSRMKVEEVEGDEIVEVLFLDRFGCSKDDLRVALYMLLAEELIAYINNSYCVTPTGLFECRRFVAED